MIKRSGLRRGTIHLLSALTNDEEHAYAIAAADFTPPGHAPWEAHHHAGWIGPGWPESLPVHRLQLYFILLSLAAAALAF
jgi:hypothetical protein